MNVSNDWTSFISQTGTELVSIAKECKIIPGRVITNNPKKMSNESIAFFKKHGTVITHIPFNPAPEVYIGLNLQNKKLITLNGYLRILPRVFLATLRGKIYNGHPALINKYPDLKGLNKQEDVFTYKDKYPTIGSVIHEVTPVLDSGHIVASVEVPNVCTSIDDAYYILRKTSLASWKIFFAKFGIINNTN